jgi:hypothetical protein
MKHSLLKLLALALNSLDTLSEVKIKASLLKDYVYSKPKLTLLGGSSSVGNNF